MSKTARKPKPDISEGEVVEVQKGEKVEAVRVPDHRKCPLCYQGQGGLGRAYSTQGMRTYYRCQCCGHTWTVEVRRETTVIQHRTVEVETRSDPLGP